MEFLKTFPKDRSLYFLGPEEDAFEKVYLETRNREGRLYPDELVLQLPDIPDTHPHSREWQLRQRNTSALLNHLSRQEAAYILDLGCGNGWFTNKLASLPECSVLGLDINAGELRQAARLFNKAGCSFAYGNVFTASLPAGFFDIVVVNSCIQYFPDLEKLIVRLKQLIRMTGEIHLLDSPFYKPAELKNARQRSVDYYRDRGIPDMAQYYFHHSWKTLEKHNYSVQYDPGSFLNKWRRSIYRTFSPFPWIIIKRDSYGK